MIEQRHEAYHVRDLRSTLGTIVNGQPIGDHFYSEVNFFTSAPMMFYCELERMK
jgi:pSer/pThr/pTyr-binding forkhead associated (FHA) protein